VSYTKKKNILSTLFAVSFYPLHTTVKFYISLKIEIASFHTHHLLPYS